MLVLSCKRLTERQLTAMTQRRDRDRHSATGAETTLRGLWKTVGAGAFAAIASACDVASREPSEERLAVGL